MRAALRAVANVLITTGVLLVIDAGLTLLWQEPITALYAQIHQNDLGGQLGRLDRRPPTPQEATVLRILHADSQRIAFLARAFRRRAHDGQAIGRIRIPHIHASYVVVEGTDSGALQKGPGHYPATP